MQRISSPHKFFKTTQKALSLSFFQRGGYFLPLVGCWRQWENKEEGEKRMILTRNNSFDFDGDLKTNENEVRERSELKTKNFLETWLCVCGGEMDSFVLMKRKRKTTRRGN